jgi:ATP-binding cassette subfamily B protein
MTDSDDQSSFAAAWEQTAGSRPALAALLSDHCRGRLPLLGAAVVSTVAWRLANLVAPYLLGETIDALLVPGGGDLSLAGVPQAWIPAAPAGQFRVVAGVFLALAAGTVVVNALRVATWRWLQQSVLHDVRVDAFAATQRLDVAFFESERTGDVTSVLTSDVNQLRSFLDDGLQDALQLGAFVVVLPAVMLALHWQLTLVVAGFVPVMVAMVAAYQRTVESIYAQRRERVGALNAHVKTAVDGIETVKAFTAEDRERDRLRSNSRAFWRTDWRAAKRSAVFFPLRQGVSLATMLAVVVVGGWWTLFGPPFVFDAPLSTGRFVTFYFYSQMFVAQSARIGDLADTYADASASARRVLGLQRQATNDEANREPVRLDDVNGRIEYENVSFTYPDGDEPAVRDVSFTVEPGAFVGIVGPTGAGKSTVTKLLLRFYDPDGGTITVDGVDVTDVAVEDLRESVGYVSQEPFLFEGTVAENIAYGGDPNRDDVVAAATSANAHEFVTDLPDGYDTEVGERGARLSGGQRQRLAIARTVYSDPDVLVLDEATSHVDNRTELLVQHALESVVEDRTTFAIAHSLATVRTADQVLVFDDGRMVERGTHEDLADADGLYASLWRAHLGDASALAAEDDSPVPSAK